MPIAPKHDWTPIRDAFISESPRPSYAELSERFSVPTGTLARVVSDEGWADLRQTRLAALAQTSGALEVITKASTESRVLSSMAFEALSGIVSSVVSTLAIIEKDQELKPRSRSDMLNTLAFAMQNASNAAKGFGITSLPEALKKAAAGVDGGLDGRGQWTPQMLQALNITITNMAAAPASAGENAKEKRTESVPVSVKEAHT